METPAPTAHTTSLGVRSSPRHARAPMTVHVTTGYRGVVVASQADGGIGAGTMLGDFRVEGVLAEGGMSTVYSAVHPLIGKKAAIKVISQQLSIDASAVEAFLQEARDVNQIRHPNIVDVFAFGALPDHRSYYVMEWLDGESLRDRLSAGAISLAQSCEILIQVCDALEAVHEKNIVHLDLKPENIYLVPLRSGHTQVKLLDFGIAKLFDSNPSTELERRGDCSPGTPDYMSPEQAEGKRVNQRSDIYSLGVMAFEMFLDRRPFVGEHRASLLVDHITRPPPRPSLLWPQIPAALEAILLALLAKDPASRPLLSTARAVLVELRDASLQVRTEHPRPPQRAAALEKETQPLRAVPRRDRRLLAAAIISATALVGGVAWSQLGHPMLLSGSALAETAPVASAEAAPPSAMAEVGGEPLGQRPATLVLMFNTATARVVIDGKLVSDDSPRVEVALNGEDSHNLVVTAHGYRDYQRRISAEPGETVELAVNLNRTGRLRAGRVIDETDYIIDSSGRSR